MYFWYIFIKLKQILVVKVEKLIIDKVSFTGGLENYRQVEQDIRDYLEDF